jgi:hypothetical protein
MNPVTLNKLLQADAKATYAQWTDTLRLLRQVGEPSARKMLEADLADLHAKAYELRWTNQLQGINQSTMNIILSRTIEQWLVLNRNPNAPII